MKETSEESFIYFEQIKPFEFKPHAVPISKYGHWMDMEVADYNGDGKPDIVLSNYASGFLFEIGTAGMYTPAWRKDLPFVVLQNNFK